VRSVRSGKYMIFDATWDCSNGYLVIACAADIPGSKRSQHLGYDESYQYFNSGVLLFDLDQWRKKKAFEEIVTYIQNNTDKLIDPDQDALNACFYDNRYSLDSIWNVIAPFTWADNELSLSRKKCKEIARNAQILHFNGQSKPWHYLNTHPRKKEYWHYVNMSPWRDARQEGRTMINRIKKLYNYLAPRRLRVLIAGLRS